MITVIDRALLAAQIDAARSVPRQRTHRNFHPGDDYPAHRLLIAIEPDSYVPPHRHLSASKDESLLVLKGCLGAVFFDADGQVVRSLVLRAGGEAMGVDIPHGVYHTVIALESGTVFFEAKSGPYVALTQAERAGWAPGEGESGVAAYLEGLRALFDVAGGSGLSD